MVLLVIDAQQGICNEKLYRFDAFVSTVQTLLSCAREKDVEVIFVRHDDGAGQLLTKGNAAFEVDTAFAPLPGEKVFDKKVNSPSSCFVKGVFTFSARIITIMWE